MELNLHVKPFSFRLNQELKTSKGTLKGKRGWLIRLENKSGEDGWGEVSPLNSSELAICGKILENLRDEISFEELEAGIPTWPGALAFGIGAALAELQGLIGSKSKTGWLSPPPSAILLPKRQFLSKAIDSILKTQKTNKIPLTVKWKIAIESKNKEEAVLIQILERLPTNTRIRLDANEGLDRFQAKEWSSHFLKEPRLEWLEQPLPADDIEGLSELAMQIPIALDESLFFKPSLRKNWQGWQVRRPVLEGDPRILLKELNEGKGYRTLSTAFETGIGLRWIHHLAALQQQGPTPVAPGLAPGWSPHGPLFSSNPIVVWKAA